MLLNVTCGSMSINSPKRAPMAVAIAYAATIPNTAPMSPATSAYNVPSETNDWIS